MSGSLQAWRIAALFAAGGLIGAMGTWATALSQFRSALGVDHLPPGSSLVLLVAASFLGGTIAGSAVRASGVPAMSVGTTFAIGNSGSLLGLMGIQAMSGNPFVMFVFFGMFFGGAWAVAGMAGLGLARVGHRVFAVGLAGYCGGAVAAAVLATVSLAGGTRGFTDLSWALVLALPSVAPAATAGVALGLALRRRSSSNQS